MSKICENQDQSVIDSDSLLWNQRQLVIDPDSRVWNQGHQSMIDLILKKEPTTKREEETTKQNDNSSHSCLVLHWELEKNLRFNSISDQIWNYLFRSVWI